MEKRKQTVVKLAQTALLAALCFVSFTFLDNEIAMPGWRRSSPLYRECILCSGSIALRRLVWWTGRRNRDDDRRCSGSDLYRGSAKDICVEALYWSDCRICGTSYREN